MNMNQMEEMNMNQMEEMNMEQMQAFIEKAKSDNALMAKLDELGAAGASAEEIVALAAEHGFSITVEDYQSAGMPKSGELAEEDLDVVSGGGTQDRWDPKECCHIYGVAYRCVGFLTWCWCDHFSRTLIDSVRNGNYQVKCGMGRFDYIRKGPL